MKLFDLMPIDRPKHPVVTAMPSDSWVQRVAQMRCPQCFRWWDEHTTAPIDIDLSEAKTLDNDPQQALESGDVGPFVLVRQARVRILRNDLVQHLSLPNGFHVGRVSVDGRSWPLYASVIADPSVRVRIVPVSILQTGSCPKCNREGMVGTATSLTCVEREAVADRHVVAGRDAGSLPYISDALLNTLPQSIREATLAERVELR